MITRVRVPASSANLGPGFDVLGLALAKYLTVSATQASEFCLRSFDREGAPIADRSGLVRKIVHAVRGDDKIHLEVNSEIPLARGLGSSGALALGIALALGHPDPVSVACELEGHPENVAASFWGGAVVAGVVDHRVQTRSLRVDSDLCCVAVIPEMEISTEQARKLLPTKVSLKDAASNLTHALLLAESLGDVSVLTPELFCDRWHQDVRSALFPEAPRVLEALVEAGARGAAWSGSGSALIGFSTIEEASEVASRVVKKLADLEVTALVEVTQVDRTGVVVE